MRTFRSHSRTLIPGLLFLLSSGSGLHCTSRQPVHVVVQIVRQSSARPVAYAGPDQLAGADQVVHLDGRKSLDPNENFLRYGWQQLEGPAVILLNADTATPSFYAALEGVYRFALVVDNGQQESEADEVVVQVIRQLPGKAGGKWIWWALGAAAAGGVGAAMFSGTGDDGPATGAIDFEIDVP